MRPALNLPVPARRPVVATGAELKSTFCVARGGDAFLSAHLGDLEGESTRAYLERDGFRVPSHRLDPPNDGGISFGQAAVAAARESG
jgi:hydrogenase maturation protein HypF